MDEMPLLGILRWDSCFQVTWQDHWGKIIGFSIAGFLCKYKQSGSLYLHCLTVSSLALVLVAEEFDFCLYESVSGHSHQRLPRHARLCSIKQMQRWVQKVGPAVFIFSYHTELRARRTPTVPGLQKDIDSSHKPTGSQAAKAIVHWWILVWILHVVYRESLSRVQGLGLCHVCCVYEWMSVHICGWAQCRATAHVSMTCAYE